MNIRAKIKAKLLLKSFFVLLISAFAIQSFAVWSDATDDPIDGNIYPPVNTGLDIQQKLGPLLFDGGRSTSVMIVDGSATVGGFLGVGTEDPEVALDVVGQFRITDGTEGVGKVLASDANGLTSWISPATIPWSGDVNADGNTLFGNEGANEDLTLEGTSSPTKTSSYVILQPTGGNVGIGTITPTALLHVNGDTRIDGLILLNNQEGAPGDVLTSNGPNPPTWEPAGSGGQTPWAGDINAAGFTLFGNSIANGDLILEGTSDPTKTSSYIILNPTEGNVGIGTATPSAKLSVKGTTGAGLELIPYGTGAGNMSELRFLELVANGTNYIGFKSPDLLTANKIYTLPALDGDPGEVLKTDGAGVLTWGTAGGGGGAISGLTVATATNTINNATYLQEWQWNTLGNGTGLKLSSTSTQATGGQANNHRILEISLSGANANASQATNGLKINNTHTGTDSLNYGAHIFTSGGTKNYGALIKATGAATENVAASFEATGGTTNYAIVAAGAVQLTGLGSGSGQTSELHFEEILGQQDNYVGFKGPDNISANKVWTLPSADGTSGQFLKTDGTGILSWATAGAGPWTNTGANVHLVTGTDKVGIGTNAPSSKLDIAVTAQSALIAGVTSTVANHALAVDYTRTSNYYTPGLVWYALNNNPTAPKAGIFMQDTDSGSKMFLGTSNNYVSGITNQAITIDPSGFIGIGATSPTSQLHLSSIGAKTASYTGVLHSVTNTSSTASVNKIGLDIQSNGTWNGTSAVNTGLNVNVSGGTTNYSAIFTGGPLSVKGTSWPAIELPPWGTGAGNTSQIRFFELAANGINWVSFSAPDNLAASNAYKLPTGFPAASGYSLTSDTTGILSWADVGASGGGWTDNGTTVTLTTTGDSVGIGMAPTKKLSVSSDALIDSVNVGGGSAGGETFFGKNALQTVGASTYNSAFGDNALAANTTGVGNTAVGFEALKSTTISQFNTAVGDQALWVNVAGFWNTAVGMNALKNTSSPSNNGDGSDNVGVGVGAGDTISTGSGNTIIGTNADVTSGILDNATAIGYGASVGASNKVRIGNGAVTVIEGQVDFTFPSDIRTKKNIKDTDLGLDFISKLHPVSFNRIGGDNLTNYGFIAQEVEKLVGSNTRLVLTDSTPEGNKTMSYTQLIAPMVKSIQEQQKQIEALKKEIETLKSR